MNVSHVRILNLVFQAFDASPHIKTEDMERVDEAEDDKPIDLDNIPKYGKVFRLELEGFGDFPPPIDVQVVLLDGDAVGIHESSFVDVMLKLEEEVPVDPQVAVWTILHADDPPDDVLTKVTGFLDMVARAARIMGDLI